MPRNEELRRELEWLRDWMTRKLSNLEQRSPKGHSHSVTGTDSWAVAAIPDWDLKQRREQVENMIAGLDAPDSPYAYPEGSPTIEEMKGLFNRKEAPDA